MAIGSLSAGMAALIGAGLSAAAGGVGAAISSKDKKKELQNQKDLANIHTTASGVGGSDDFGADLVNPGMNPPKGPSISLANKTAKPIFNPNMGSQDLLKNLKF